MTDQLGETLEFRLFSFYADNPISAHPLVPGSLRTEKFPGGLVGAKLLGLFTGELGVLPLLVRIDGRLFFIASGESLQASGLHQALHCEFLNKFDIDGTPGAGGLAGSEANAVAGFVEALANAVDPAETECNLYGFGPGDAGLSGAFFVEANE